MAKRLVSASLTINDHGRKVWCHYGSTYRIWKEVCWVGVMGNLLVGAQADSIEKEKTCTRLQCVSCFTELLSN